MRITPEQVRHVALLARLDLDETAIDELVGQIGDILAYMDQLNELDTTGVEPMSHALNLTNALRGDDPAPHLDRETALANAPASGDGGFIVPKVVG